MTRVHNTSLIVPLLLSALAHAMTLAGSWLHLPSASISATAPPPLTARLYPVAPTVAPAPPPPPVAKPAAKPRARPTAVAAAPVMLPLHTPAPWALPAIDTPDDPVPQASKVAGEPDAPGSEAEPVVLAHAAPSTFAPEPAVIKTLPRRGRITYDLNYYLSDAPTLVGRTVQTWQATDDSYQLNSLSETVGLARLLAARFGPRTYHSSGSVTERGLQPQRFTAQVVMRGKADDSAAQFDWAGNALQFGRANDQKNAALPAGSQDLLSFMYQLSLAPPTRGRLQMPITNGTRFENYEIDVLDEEMIDTPLGRLRTLPVKQVRRQGRESIEVWLAAEHHYLPVRILVRNRDGTPGGEQVATAINIGEQ